MATQRLKDLIAHLYHPIPGQRQVLAVSRAEAEQLPPLASVAVISVTAPGKPAAKLTSFTHVLRLSFADVDSDRRDLSDRERKKLPDAFRPDQAAAVLQFLQGLPATVTSIVVHCEGGYSRSSAIVRGLAELYGYQDFAPHARSANPSVLALLLSTHRMSRK